MTTFNTENQERESCPVDLIAFYWAETLSAGEQNVLLTSSLRRLQNMINACVNAGGEEDDPSVGKFIATVADGLRHAIRDHGDITKERIGSAAKRVWGRIRGTRYDPFRSRQPHTSDESWREWFKCLGDRATADVVKATADLVTNERLAALVEARVLPATTPPATAGDAHEHHWHHRVDAASLCCRCEDIPCVPTPSSSARAAAEELEKENFLLSDVTPEERDQITAIIDRHFTKGESTK